LQSATSYTSINSGGQSSPQVQYYSSRRSSVHSNTEPQEVADANVKFVRDTSRIWYKPNISREQGNFLIWDHFYFFCWIGFLFIVVMEKKCYFICIYNYDRARM